MKRLLTASAIEVSVRDPRDPGARHCLRAYVGELAGRFDGGFDPERSISAADHEMTLPEGLFLVATLHGEPAGCGALKFHPGAPAEVKRMWVAPAIRGLGLGRRLLTELEARAAAHGIRVLRLETNRALAEAISLYRAAGYREVPPFNDEPYAHHWFEKVIAPGNDTDVAPMLPERIPAKRRAEAAVPDEADRTAGAPGCGSSGHDN